MIRGPLRNAGLIGGPMEREVFDGISRAEDFHFVEVQVFFAWQLNADEARLMTDQIYFERALVREAEESFASMPVNDPPLLAIVGQAKHEVGGAGCGQLAIATIPDHHAVNWLHRAQIDLPPRSLAHGGVKAPFAVLDSIATTSRILARGDPVR